MSSESLEILETLTPPDPSAVIGDGDMQLNWNP